MQTATKSNASTRAIAYFALVAMVSFAVFINIASASQSISNKVIVVPTSATQGQGKQITITYYPDCNFNGGDCPTANPGLVLEYTPPGSSPTNPFGGTIGETQEIPNCGSTPNPNGGDCILEPTSGGVNGWTCGSHIDSAGNCYISYTFTADSSQPTGTYAFTGYEEDSTLYWWSQADSFTGYFAIYPVGYTPSNTQLTIGAPKIPPGASTLLNYSFPIPTTQTVCGSSIPSIEISAPGSSCNPGIIIQQSGVPPPLHIPFCFENQNGADSHFTNGAWPPCVGDLAEIYNSMQKIYNTCTGQYYTNYTLPQGNYSICGYSQIGGGQVQSTDGNLNVSTNLTHGESYGLYLDFNQKTFTASGGIGLSLNANTLQGSPWVTYWSAQGDGSIVSTPCTRDNTCVIELASADKSGGCTAPGFTTQIRSCSTGGQLPCLISGSALGGTATISGGVLQPSNSYVVCAYSYFWLNLNTVPYHAPVLLYPSNAYSQSQAYDLSSLLNPPSNPKTPGISGNPALPFSPFFATANIICDSSGNCVGGPSVEEPPEVITGTTNPGLGIYGAVNLEPVSYTIAGQSPSAQTVNAYVDGIPGGAPIGVIFTKLQSPLAFSNFANLCQQYLSVKTSCTDTSSDQNGCAYTFSVDTGGVIKQTGGSTTGVSATCSQVQLPGGQGACGNPNEGGCNYGATNTGFSCNVILPVAPVTTNGLYAYCATYGGSFVAGALFSNGASFTGQASGIGALSIGSVLSSVCGFYSTINNALFIIGLTLMLLGAIFYTLSNILPAQVRGTLQAYAMAMFLAGIVGIVIASFSLYFISLAGNVPLSTLVSTCP